MNTNEAVEKLIAASKKLLQEDLHPSLQAMFEELYSPLQRLPLREKPFAYRFQYQYCSAEANIPAVKEVGKVYWFIDQQGTVRYQVLISQDPAQLHQGQLEEGITTPVPEFKYEMQKKTTTHNGVSRTQTVKQITACAYIFSYNGVEQRKSIPVEINDNYNTLQEKARTGYLKQIARYPLMISPEIERKIGAALNVQHILAPAEEDFSIFLMPRYKEIIKTEKDILNFVSELIDLLQDESFKVIFARNPEALELITNILKVAQEIQVDQKAILVSLEGNSNSSAELISRIEQAYRHCDQKNYQEMAFLIDSFDKIMKRERYRDAVKIFGTSKVNALKKIETPLSLIANTLFPFLENLSLDTRFSTQLILRRQMTYQTFIQSFTEKHANIGALETLYNGLFATNRAINRMQTIEAARVGFEGICFQLVTKVFDLLTESKPSFLKEDDLNKIMEKRKAIIIAYLKRLEQKVLKGISTEVIVFERTAVSDVIMAINSNTTTPQDIVVAVTGLLNALPHNFRNVDLADQWEDIPMGQEDFDEWEMIDEDKKEKIVEKSNLSMGVASSGSPNFFRSSAGGTVPTPDAAQSSAEKSNEKKPMPTNNGTPLMDEMARSKLFQTRMDRT